ncbi:MAG: hypothetical protein AAB497_03725 [Patescibacteria group bacterium]
MNTYIFQTIRAIAVLGIALFAFAGEVFAAPVLTGPTEAVQTTETSATLVGYVENTYKTSLVWFEWSDSSSMYSFTPIGLTRVFDRGFFKASLSGLNPGATYYYRAVSSEGGTTVYSQIISFKTKGGSIPVTATTVSYQNTTITNSSVTKPVVAQTKKSTTSTVVAKKTTTVAKVATSTQEGFTNKNANVATVIGAGDMLPKTLIGWVALIVALLIAVLLALMIYESSEKQKKARKAKKLQVEEVEQEVSEIDKILEKNR